MTALRTILPFPVDRGLWIGKTGGGGFHDSLAPGIPGLLCDGDHRLALIAREADAP